MWGRLTLQACTSEGKNLFPNVIDLDSSKSCHFLGRLPNPSGPQFKHKSQHALTVSFLSATHCSISIDTSDASNLKYILSDHSTNGTYVRYRNHVTVDDAVLVGNTNWVNIGNNDDIVFKFKGSAPIVYKFTTCCEPLEVSLPGIVPASSAASVHSHQSSTNQSLAQHQVQQLQEDLKVTEERLAATVAKYESAQAENATHQREAASLQDRVASLEADLAKAKESLALFESNLSATEAFNRKLKAQVQDLKDSSAALVTKLENAAEEVRHKADQVGKRDLLIAELNQALAAETDARAVVESENKSLRSKLEEEGLRSSRLANANTLLQGVVGEHEQTVAALTADYDALAGLVRKTASEEATHRALVQSRLVELQQMTSGVTALVSDASWSEAVLAQLRNVSSRSTSTTAKATPVGSDGILSQLNLNRTQYEKLTQFGSYWGGSEGPAGQGRLMQQDGTEIAPETQLAPQSSGGISLSYQPMRHLTQQPHTRLFSQADSIPDNDTTPFRFSNTPHLNPSLSANGCHTQAMDVASASNDEADADGEEGQAKRMRGVSKQSDDDEQSRDGSRTESSEHDAHFAMNMTQLPQNTSFSDDEDDADDADATTDKLDHAVSATESAMEVPLDQENEANMPAAAESAITAPDVEPVAEPHSTPSALSETVCEQLKSLNAEQDQGEKEKEKEKEAEEREDVLQPDAKEDEEKIDQKEEEKEEVLEEEQVVVAQPTNKRSRGAKSATRLSLSQPAPGDNDSVASQQSKRGRHARSTVRAVTTPTSANSKKATITSDPTHGAKTSRHAAKRSNQSGARRKLDTFDEVDENSGPEKANSQTIDAAGGSKTLATQAHFDTSVMDEETCDE